MTRSLPIAAPDFDALKLKLKEFLQSQDTLKDYNFDGSVLNTILDVLSYNSYVNAFYLNQTANEAFLETAQRRSSVVELAKPLGYTPRSARGARQNATLTLQSALDTTLITIPSGFTINARSDNQVFSFSLVKSAIASKQPNGSFVTDVLQFVEGKRLSFSFTCTTPLQKFIIPNKGVDTTALRVYVARPMNLTSFTEHQPVADITDLDNESSVYYLEEVEGERHAVQFGDGVLSKGIEIGSIVKIEYFVSAGSEANGITQFAVVDSIPGVSSIELSTIGKSSGGSELESIESIKFTAPKLFNTQNRAVTTSDYASIILQNYTNAADVLVLGGENIIPPQFNQIFVYIKPRSGFFLSEVEKKQVETIVRKFGVILQRVNVQDPNYTYVDVDTVVDYRKDTTDLSQGTIAEIISAAVRAFELSDLAKFGGTLRKSRLQAVIDNAHPSITSNECNIALEKRIFSQLEFQKQHQVFFDTQIVAGSVASSTFTLGTRSGCQFLDNSFGSVSIIDANTGELIAEKVGSIDYETGLVTIFKGVRQIEQNDLRYDGDLGQFYISYSCKAINRDINKSKSQIVVFKDIKINPKPI